MNSAIHHDFYRFLRNSLLCAFLLAAPRVFLSAGVEDDLAAGRLALRESDLTTAAAAFARAADAASWHEQANAYAGLTGAWAVVESPAFLDLLERAGFNTAQFQAMSFGLTIPADQQGRNLYNPDFSTSEARHFIQQTLLPEIERAETYLSRVASDAFWLVLEAGETGGQRVEIDLADILVTRALLQAAAALASIAVSHDLDFSPFEIEQWGADYSHEYLLWKYPGLLTARAPSLMGQARDHLSRAVDLYCQASPRLRARVGVEKLFSLDYPDLSAEALFSDSLGELQSALHGPTTLDRLAEALDWSHDPKQLNLAPLFSGSYNPRGYLPWLVRNRINYYTILDPTFGGLLPGQDLSSLQNILPWGITDTGDLIIHTVASFTQDWPAALQAAGYTAYAYDSWESEFVLKRLLSPSGKVVPGDEQGYGFWFTQEYPSGADLAADFPSGWYTIEYVDRRGGPTDSYSFTASTNSPDPLLYTGSTYRNAQVAPAYEDFRVQWIPPQVPAEYLPYTYFWIQASNELDGLWWSNEESGRFISVLDSEITLPGHLFTPGSTVTVTLVMGRDQPLLRRGGTYLSVYPTTSVETSLTIHVGDFQFGPAVSSSGKVRDWTLDTALPGSLRRMGVQPYAVLASPQGYYVSDLNDDLVAADDPSSRGVLRLRLNDGSHDPSFRLDSRVRNILGMTLAPDGGLYVGAMLQGEFGDGVDPVYRVVKLHPDGSLDPAFLTPPLAFHPRFMALDPVSRKLLCAQASDATDTGLEPRPYRFNSDGSVDPLFNAARLPNLQFSFASPVFDGQGRVYLTGYSSNSGGHLSDVLVRLNRNGSIDSTFQPDQRILSRSSYFNIRGCGVQSDGKVIIGGRRMDYQSAYSETKARYPLLRLLPDGTLDTGFNLTAVENLFDRTTSLTPVRMLLVLPNDRILVLGAGLTRLLPDGSPDPDFHSWIFTSESSAFNERFQMSLDESGRILLAGAAYDPAANPVLRLLPDGRVDPTFKAPDFSQGTVGITAYEQDGWIHGVFTTRGGAVADRLEAFPSWPVVSAMRWDRNDEIDFGYLPLREYYADDSDFYLYHSRPGPDGPVFWVDSRDGHFLLETDSDGSSAWPYYMGPDYHYFTDVISTRDELFVLDTGSAETAILHRPSPYYEKFALSWAYPVDHFLGTSPDGTLFLSAAADWTGESRVVLQVRPDGTLLETFNSYAAPSVGFSYSSPFAGLKVVGDGSILLWGQFTQYAGHDVSGLVHLHPDGTRQPSNLHSANFLTRTDGRVPRVSSATLDAENNLWLVGNFDRCLGVPVHHLVQVTLDGRLLYGGDARLRIHHQDQSPAILAASTGHIYLSGALQVDGEPGPLPMVRLVPSEVALVTPSYPDWNGDGRHDLFWRSPGPGHQWGQVTNPLAHNQYPANLVWTYLGGSEDWRITAFPDWNGDGRTDVLWQQVSTQRHWAQVMAGFVDGGVATSQIWSYLGGDAEWRIVGTADWNGDDKSDLLWQQRSTGRHWAQVLQDFPDGGVVTNAAWTYLGGDDEWRIAGLPDWNGDGKCDLLWQQRSTSRHWAQVVGGLPDGGVVTSQVWCYLGGDADWTISLTGDFDGDDRSDVIWRHQPTGYQWVQNYQPLRDGTVADPAGWYYLGGSQDWQVLAAPDWNGDGRQDLFWIQHSTALVFAEIRTLQNGLASQVIWTPLGQQGTWQLMPFGL